MPDGSMHVPLLDLRAQYAAMRSEIRATLDAVLESQRFVLGEHVSALETEVARYCRAAHAVGVASGSDALLLALMAIGIEPGDEVITTPFTFFATAAAIVRLGGRPVFVDIEPATFNLAVAPVEARISARTKAIIPVHLYGQCVNMAPLLAVARAHGIMVIEDAAQALGAAYHAPQPAGGTADAWQLAGTIGDVGCLSFYPSKVLGAYGDAGMMLIQDDALAERALALRTHGSLSKYRHDLLGVNSRLDELQAAVLRVKLRYLDGWINARQARAADYNQLFHAAGLAASGEPAGAERPVTLPAVAPHCRHIFYVYTVRVQQREPLRQHLAQHGVETDVYYPLPLHVQPCFSALGYRHGDFPAAEQAADEVLALPMYPELRPEQQQYVVQRIADFYRHYA